MTEVTPSCDSAHNDRQKGTHGGLPHRLGTSTIVFGNSSFGQREIPYDGPSHSILLSGGSAPYSPVLRARHKTLPWLYQTLRSNKRNRGFNKRQRKLSRRNENETQFLDVCCGAAGRSLLRRADDHL